MHKNIGAAAIGRDKAISAICVEEFDPPTWDAHLIRFQRTVSAPTRPSAKGTGGGWAQRALRYPSFEVLNLKFDFFNPLAQCSDLSNLLYDLVLHLDCRQRNWQMPDAAGE